MRAFLVVKKFDRKIKRPKILHKSLIGAENRRNNERPNVKRPKKFAEK